MNGGLSQPGCQVPVISLQKIASRGISFNLVEGKCVRHGFKETLKSVAPCLFEQCSVSEDPQVYSLKCAPFVSLKCHYVSRQSPNTLMRLSHIDTL